MAIKVLPHLYRAGQHLTPAFTLCTVVVMYLSDIGVNVRGRCHDLLVLRD